MEEFKQCRNDIPALIAEYIGCSSIETTIPRIFIGDRSKIEDFCKSNNLHPIQYLVKNITGHTNSNMVVVEITPSRHEKVIANDIQFMTDKNIGFDSYVYVCMDRIVYDFTP